MTVTLAEAKQYLRVSTADDDGLITNIIDGALQICADTARQTVAEYTARTDKKSLIALLFALAYLYEHREEADHNKLKLDLRAVFDDREAVF